MKHLGKTSKNNFKYEDNFSLLEKIKRSKSEYFTNGIDYWNAFEFSYINQKELPEFKILQISIDSNSHNTVESKSLKLYLNSFYNQKFESNKIPIEKIKNDLNKITKSKVSCKYLTRFYDEPNAMDITKISAKNLTANQIYVYKGFRSICPVTSQPDWAFIYFYFNKSIKTEWLKKMLISFRESGEFHEECISNIHHKIKTSFSNIKVEVCGRFLRRGGIDINPIRSCYKKLIFKNFRILNQ